MALIQPSSVSLEIEEIWELRLLIDLWLATTKVGLIRTSMVRSKV